MDKVRSLWIRYGRDLNISDIEYLPLDGSPSDQDASSHQFLEFSDKPMEKKPVLSIHPSPNFSIEINFPAFKRLLLSYLLSLLPSFFFKRTKPRKLSPTSYLDGLRGVAALFVVSHHYALVFTSCSPTGYHPTNNPWIFLFPLIRALHSGRLMVTIFFVISGYVLSYRSLKLAREGKYAEVLDSLGSSVFRRWLRLHLPVLCSTYIAFILCRYEVWIDMPSGWEHDVSGSYMAHKPMPYPVKTGPWTTQWWDWFQDARNLCNPLNYGAIVASRYNINVLWSIPVEWMGSMVVFIFTLALARSKTSIKFLVLSLSIYWCHHLTQWAPATFLSGMFLAELSFTRNIPETLSPTSKKTSKRSSWVWKIFFTFFCLFALFLGSHPQEGPAETPGYNLIFTYLLPKTYAETFIEDKPTVYFPSIAAPLILFALEMAPHLQRPFTTAFAQYLGDISFSMYVLHGQILFTLGTWLVPKCMDVTGGWSNGLGGYMSGMGLALMVVWPLTIWVSDLFSRGVDERCVRFARWVCRRCFKEI